MINHALSHIIWLMNGKSYVKAYKNYTYNLPLCVKTKPYL